MWSNFEDKRVFLGIPLNPWRRTFLSGAGFWVRDSIFYVTRLLPRRLVPLPLRPYDGPPFFQVSHDPS